MSEHDEHKIDTLMFVMLIIVLMFMPFMSVSVSVSVGARENVSENE